MVEIHDMEEIERYTRMYIKEYLGKLGGGTYTPGNSLRKLKKIWELMNESKPPLISNSKKMSRAVDVHLSTLELMLDLRENYETRFRYEDAEKFFAREINLKKEYGDDSQKAISDPDIISMKIQELTKDFKELKKKLVDLEKFVKEKFHNQKKQN